MRALGLKSLVAMTLFASVANASVVCKGTTGLGLPATVEITDDKVIVSGGALSAPREFTHTLRVNGLITAAGLAVTMENHFGCLRQAVIITEFQEPFDAGYMEVMHVRTCAGGTTDDVLCGARTK